MSEDKNEHELKELEESVLNSELLKQDIKPVEVVNGEDLIKYIDLVKDRYDGLIFDEDSIRQATKRGGDLQILRKIRGQINDIKMETHRKAKDSYSDSDEFLNEQLSRLDETFDNIKGQADEYEQKRKESVYDHIKEIFEEKGKLPEYKDMNVNFNEFFDDKMLNKTQSNDKVINENVTNYYAKKFDEFAKISHLSERIDSKVWTDTVLKLYNSGVDIDDAIASGYEAKEDFERKLQLEKERIQLEEKKPKKDEIEEIDTKQENNGKPKKVKDDIYFTFAVKGIKNGKAVEKLLNDNGIKHNVKGYQK